MESPDPTSSLSDDDLLSLNIGRVVRAHARVEYGLRNVYQALDSPNSPDNVAPGFVGAERLVNDCMARLRRVAIGPELTASGERSLRAAQEANALRNVIVHDLWLLESDGRGNLNPRWNTFGPTRGEVGTVVRQELRGIPSIEEARTALERAAVRVSGLFMALNEVLPRFEKSTKHRGWTSGLSIYVALMDGHFRLAQNGDWEVELPA